MNSRTLNFFVSQTEIVIKILEDTKVAIDQGDTKRLDEIKHEIDEKLPALLQSLSCIKVIIDDFQKKDFEFSNRLFNL